LGWRAKRVGARFQPKNWEEQRGNWRLDRRATNPKIFGDSFHNWLFYHADLG
jgi:hypothetical protein